MANRQDMTLHRVILATKTYEMRYNIDPDGADGEAEERQDAYATTVSPPDPRLAPVPPGEDRSQPEETSSPP